MSSSSGRLHIGAIIMSAIVACTGCFPERVDTNTPPSTNETQCEDSPQCDALPESVCENRLAVSYTRDPSGCTCDAFKQYVDCAARGERCADGTCVEVSEACQGVFCSPRTPECNGSVLLTFDQPGVCSDETGDCEFDPSMFDCMSMGLRCLEGRCAPLDDPCETEECARPARRCDGDTQIRHSGNGTCTADGATAMCDYARVEQRVDCAADGKSCMGGNCIDPDMPCEGVMCDMPPAASCDAMVAVTYNGDGTCNMADGMCDYAPVEVRTDCAAMNQVCMNGACLADNPCDTVMCNMPPVASCDAMVAVTYSMDDGVCNMADGMCDYSASEIRTDCAAMTNKVCVNGMCQDPANPCMGVMCDMPPAASCDAMVAVTYSGDGTCNMADGMCDYAPVEVRTDCAAMAQTCMNGACQAANPCMGVMCDMPPAASCDAMVAVTYSGDGTCNMVDGMCDYAPVEVRTDCAAMAQVCMSGACQDPDLCAGVMCDMPPAASCDAMVAVTYSGDGTCNMADGMCDYAPVEVRTDCAAMAQVCVNGMCM